MTTIGILLKFLRSHRVMHGLEVPMIHYGQREADDHWELPNATQAIENLITEARAEAIQEYRRALDLLDPDIIKEIKSKTKTIDKVSYTTDELRYPTGYNQAITDILKIIKKENK